jgi:hypothetical protein
MALYLSCPSVFKRANLTNKHVVKQEIVFKFDLNILHSYTDKNMCVLSFFLYRQCKDGYHAYL